jgi:hypothetical protein
MVVYMCGPISDTRHWVVRWNLEEGVRMARYIQNYCNVQVFSPHAHSIGIRDEANRYGAPEPYERILFFDIALLGRFDALYAMEGWTKSAGCIKEIAYAHRHGIPVFHAEEELRCYAHSTFPLRTLEQLETDTYTMEGRS